MSAVNSHLKDAIMKKYFFSHGILAFIAALFTVSSAKASESVWVDVAEDSNGSDVYYDLNSIRFSSSKDSFYFWEKHIHKFQQKNGVKYYLAYWFIDCQLGEMAVIEQIQYNSRGAVIKTWDFSDSIQKMNPPPDSVGKQLLNDVCEVARYLKINGHL